MNKNITLKESKILVRILGTSKVGSVVFRQCDFFGNTYFGVLVGAKTLLYRPTELKFIRQVKN